MPREKVGDFTTEGRYVQVNWRRDEGEPGYVQVSTHGPDGRGSEYVHLDAEGLDRAIRTLHKAKRQAFGDPIADYDSALRHLGDVAGGGVQAATDERRAHLAVQSAALEHGDRS